jgi:hypothetical protein
MAARGSVGIENQSVFVSEWDLDWLAGLGVLVENVEVWLRIVVWNPFADRLPRAHDLTLRGGA